MFNFFTNLPEISLTLRNIFKTEMIGGLLAKGVTVEAATLLEAKSLAKGRVEQQQRHMYPNVPGTLSMVKKSDTVMQSFCCFTVFGKHKRKANDDDGQGQTCTFRIIFRIKHINGRVVMTCSVADLPHTCQTASHREYLADNADGAEIQLSRERNVSVTTLTTTSPVLQSWQTHAPARNSGSAAALLNVTRGEKEVNMTVHQARRYGKTLNKDAATKPAVFEQFSQLPHYILLMQAADPSGFYYLHTTTDVHGTNGYGVDIDDSCRVFKSYTLVPSASIHLWATSSRVTAVDGAFVSTHHGGTLIIATVKDFNNFVHILMVSLNAGTETAHTMECFLRRFHAHFPNLRFILTDKGSATTHSRTAMNRAGKSHAGTAPEDWDPADPYSVSHYPVWGLCRIHCLRNAGNECTLTRKLAMESAMSTTTTAYTTAMTKLSREVSPSSFHYLQKHRRDCTFLGHQKRGLTMDFGCESSNNAEQAINVSKATRESPVITGIVGYIREFNTKMATSELKVNEQHRQGVQIGDGALPLVRKLAEDLVDSYSIGRPMLKVTTATDAIPDAVITLTATIYKRGASQVSHMVRLSPNAPTFEERIKCQCFSFQRSGHPCAHAALILYKMPITLNEHSIKAEGHWLMHAWSLDAKCWYHPAYHVPATSSYTMIDSPLIPVDGLHQVKLLPPQMHPRKAGKRRHTRYRGRGGNATAGATTPNLVTYTTIQLDFGYESSTEGSAESSADNEDSDSELNFTPSQIAQPSATHASSGPTIDFPMHSAGVSVPMSSARFAASGGEGAAPSAKKPLQIVTTDALLTSSGERKQYAAYHGSYRLISEAELQCFAQGVGGQHLLEAAAAAVPVAAAAATVPVALAPAAPAVPVVLAPAAPAVHQTRKKPRKDYSALNQGL